MWIAAERKLRWYASGMNGSEATRARILKEHRSETAAAPTLRERFGDEKSWLRLRSHPQRLGSAAIRRVRVTFQELAFCHNAMARSA
jgi:hypothetical protein